MHLMFNGCTWAKQLMKMGLVFYSNEIRISYSHINYTRWQDDLLIVKQNVADQYQTQRDNRVCQVV